MAWERKCPKVILVMPHKSPFGTFEFMEAYNQLLLPSPFRVIHNRSPLPIDDCRNCLTEEALKDNPEYILCLDDDVIPPIDVAYRLMAHSYPIVSALYPDKPGRSAASRLVDGKLEPVPWEELEGNVSFVDAIGFGCVLIDARVFHVMRMKGCHPWFEYQYHPIYRPDDPSEDHDFSLKAKHCGFSILLDGRVVCKHVFVGAMYSDQKISHLVI